MCSFLGVGTLNVVYVFRAGEGSENIIYRLTVGTHQVPMLTGFIGGSGKNNVNYHFCHLFISKYCVIIVPCKFLTISHAGLL